MNEIKNIIPQEILKDYSLSTKGVPYTNLMPQLHKYFEGIPFDGKNTFINTPIIVNAVQLNEYARLSSVLNKVIKKIVLNYFNDKRIRDIYQLDAQLESILKQAVGVPYEVGMYRPDFILNKKGQPKICEIGCRYPINGWMFSHYTRKIFSELVVEDGTNFIDYFKQHPFISTIAKDFNIKETLFYVHELEGGTEAYQFFNELKNKGFTITDISPKDLALTNNKLTVNGKIASQFIIEMDREELKKIEPEILQKLIESEKCLNDVRTLILVHDKRILSVLFDAQIVCDYISNEDYQFLKRFLIPSYILDSEERRNELINSTSNWVLKKNSGGRGIGIYVKNDCTTEIWNEVVSNQFKNYMVQEYIDQKTIDLQQSDDKEIINIVGMLLYYNEKSFGPGIFRGSSKSIINVHSGGYILPAVISK